MAFSEFPFEKDAKLAWQFGLRQSCKDWSELGMAYEGREIARGLAAGCMTWWAETRAETARLVAATVTHPRAQTNILSRSSAATMM